MLRTLPLTIACVLAVTLSGCSAGKALVMRSPAKKHTPAEQLALVAEAYEAKGDYNSAAEVYNQALALNPGNRKLERQLADVQRLARGEDPVRDPFQQLRRESSELASARRKDLQEAQASVRAVSAPAATRLQQLRKNAASVSLEEAADWNSDDAELDGLSDEELMGMESPLR
jgi:tetratricopeptide (TPR) repeat protein